MGRTPDRTPGPSVEEETQYEDRTADGDPTITGALRRIGDYLRYKATSLVQQVLQVRNYPVGFNDVDLSGVSDGQFLSYEASSKTIKPVTGSGALPAATEVGQVLFSYDGSSFTVEMPLTGDIDGWLTDDHGILLVEGG